MDLQSFEDAEKGAEGAQVLVGLAVEGPRCVPLWRHDFGANEW